SRQPEDCLLRSQPTLTEKSRLPNTWFSYDQNDVASPKLHTLEHAIQGVQLKLSAEKRSGVASSSFADVSHQFPAVHGLNPPPNPPRGLNVSRVVRNDIKNAQRREPRSDRIVFPRDHFAEERGDAIAHI